MLDLIPMVPGFMGLSNGLMKASSKEGMERNNRNETKFPYREIIGSLMHISRFTRPDISCAVGILCKHFEKPERLHWEAAKRVLSYLGTTKTLGSATTSWENSN